MPLNLKGRSILTLDELTPTEIRFLLRLAADLKAAKHAGTEQPRLKGKNIALIFEKVFESAASIAFDRAENRMPAVKAVVVATIGR